MQIHPPRELRSSSRSRSSEHRCAAIQKAESPVTQKWPSSNDGLKHWASGAWVSTHLLEVHWIIQQTFSEHPLCTRRTHQDPAGTLPRAFRTRSGDVTRSMSITESARAPHRVSRSSNQRSQNSRSLSLKWGGGAVRRQEFYERGMQGPAWESHSEGQRQVS